jgi:MSHA pilin protein MshC
MNGFTLIEVVAVLVILGILTAVALTRLSSNPNNLIAATDTLTSQLRLAQARAMSTSIDSLDPTVWGVRFISTTQYYLFYCDKASVCDPAANKKSFPGGGNIIVDLASQGVQLTNGALVLSFDRFGAPSPDAKLTTILAIPLTLTLQDNKSNTRTINITPQTGMIK